MREEHQELYAVALHYLTLEGQSRLLLLKELRSFAVQGSHLRTFFYDSVVASAIFVGDMFIKKRATPLVVMNKKVCK